MGDGYIVAYEYLDATRSMLVGLACFLGTALLAGLWWFMGNPRQAWRDWRLGKKCNPLALVVLPVMIGAWCWFVLPIMLDMTGGETIEGKVSGLTIVSRYSQPGDRSTEARFTVGDQQFHITLRNSRPNEVLDLPRWPGGPLKDGMSVRLRHRATKILVIELRKNPHDAPSSEVP